MSDLISIIIPVYNAGKTIDGCVESVLKSTYSDFEILIIDDGSNVETAEECDKVALKDHRIKVIHQENGGVSKARNCGIENAKGKFITFVDADDTVDSDLLASMMNAMRQEQADVVITGHRECYDDGSFKECFCSEKESIKCGTEIAMLVAVCIIILNKMVDWRGSISKYFAPVMALLFTIATVLYTEFMKGNLFPGFDIYNFTTGRDYILSLWNQINYMSYGYGSSMVLIGRYLEMDLVQIYMELNIIAVFAFSYVYFKIAGENVYSILVMTYAFFNMLTASSLPGSLSWIVAFLTIASVSSDKCRQENITINEEKSHVKKLFSKKKGTRNNVQASVSYYSTSVR